MSRIVAIFVCIVLSSPVGLAFAEPIQGTGWSDDLIVEVGATDPAVATTSGRYANHVIVENGYGGPGAGGLGTPLAITNGIVTTLSGYEYLVDAAGNNSIVDSTAATEADFTTTLEGTFTLTTAKSYQRLSFLVAGIGGNGTDTNFLARVHFSDATSTDFIYSVKDWNTSMSYDAFAAKTAYIDRSTTPANSYEHWLRELQFTLSLEDAAKTVTSIDFYLDQRLGVMGVAGDPTIFPVITIDDTGIWSGFTGPGSDITISNFNASASKQLVLCVSGESGNPKALTDLTNVTYNGVSLTQAVNRDNRADAYGVESPDQSYNDIWYLPNPGSYAGSGTIQLYTTGNVRAIVTAFALSNLSTGVGNIAVSDPDSKSLELTTTEPYSLVIVSHALGGDGNSGDVVPVEPEYPLVELSAVDQSNYNGQVTAIAHIPVAGTATYMFSGGATVGANVVAIEILPPPPKGTVLIVQ